MSVPCSQTQESFVPEVTFLFAPRYICPFPGGNKIVLHPTSQLASTVMFKGLGFCSPEGWKEPDGIISVKFVHLSAWYIENKLRYLNNNDSAVGWCQISLCLSFSNIFLGCNWS